MNRDLQAFEESLSKLLEATLDVDDFIDFEKLKVTPGLPPFKPGALASAAPAVKRSAYLPEPLTWAQKIVPGAKARYDKQVAEAEAAFQEAVAKRERAEERRKRRLAEAKAAHEQQLEERRAEAEVRNREIDEFQTSFAAGDPQAITDYFSMVLEASRYPDGFSKHHRIAYVPESKQLVVEYELPSFSVVPEMREYKYVKAKDSIEAVARPTSQAKGLYANVVAQVALRTVHELFEADRGEKLETIVLNGFVSTIARATGKAVSPYLVTLRTTRDVFLTLDLAKVDPLSCLKGLNASVSKSPAELAPVRPILEFNMVDRRFVEESDVLSELDRRANLMELSPTEFENLITNLFGQMGLETRLTQASRDGGVDCVCFDPRPIMGGKVVVQAKRYKNTVGVSAVRDLYGTMMNEGASKGILVTTSGYGKAAFEFAEGKPIELLSGSNLLYLLKEHADMDAKIEAPDDWVEPAQP